MIRVRKATFEDIFSASEDALEVFSGEKGVVDGAINCLSNGRLYTLLSSDGVLLGVIGGVIVWPGVASLGSIFTRAIYDHRIGMVRTTRRVIEAVMEEYSLHRMEMAVKKDYPTGHRWAEALGFQAEGILRKYNSSKEDYVMYGRVE